MKILITLIALATITSCASKKIEETPTAKTETPVTVAATETVKPMEEAKPTASDKETKASLKKAKAEMASPAPTVGTAELNCKAGSDERKLSIQVKEAGCELQYTKSGEAKTIATQIKGSEKCEEVMTHVKEKLVAAQFSCQ